MKPRTRVRLTAEGYIGRLGWTVEATVGDCWRIALDNGPTMSFHRSEFVDMSVPVRVEDDCDAYDGFLG